MRGVVWCVAVSVGSVRCSALRGAIFVAGRLSVLPDNGVGLAAVGDGRGSLRKNTAWCGWANIVENPESELAAAEMSKNVLR